MPSIDPDAPASEAALNAYLDSFEAASDRRRGFLLKHPLTLVTAMSRVAALDRISVSPTSSGEGRLLRRILQAMQSRVRTPLHAVSAVLVIPASAGEYESGSSKQTLRRKARAAQRRGISWEAVEDPARRRSLMELADIHERTNEDDRYRNSESDHSELVGYGLWLIARSSDGDPLILSITPIDGEFGALRYFRTLRAGDEASVARYLMTQVLVEQLRLRGVRHLLDTTPSMRLPPGLRHFQRMVGFRLMRVDLRGERRDLLSSRGVTSAALRSPKAISSSFWDRVLSDVVLLRSALVTCAAALGSVLLPAVLPF